VPQSSPPLQTQRSPISTIKTSTARSTKKRRQIDGPLTVKTPRHERNQIMSVHLSAVTVRSSNLERRISKGKLGNILIGRRKILGLHGYNVTPEFCLDRLHILSTLFNSPLPLHSGLSAAKTSVWLCDGVTVSFLFKFKFKFNALPSPLLVDRARAAALKLTQSPKSYYYYCHYNWNWDQWASASCWDSYPAEAKEVGDRNRSPMCISYALW
jgi:hypothetical protein